MSQVELPPIVQTGSPVLRARAIEVPAERIKSPEFQSLISTMIATMRGRRVSAWQLRRSEFRGG